MSVSVSDFYLSVVEDVIRKSKEENGDVDHQVFDRLKEIWIEKLQKSKVFANEEPYEEGETYENVNPPQQMTAASLVNQPTKKRDNQAQAQAQSQPSRPQAQALNRPFNQPTIPPGINYAFQPNISSIPIANMPGMPGMPNIPLQNFQGLNYPQTIQGMQAMQAMQTIQGMQGMAGMQGMPGMPGMQGMPGLQGMNPGLQNLQNPQRYPSGPGGRDISNLSGQNLPQNDGPTDEIQQVDNSIKEILKNSESEVSLEIDVSKFPQFDGHGDDDDEEEEEEEEEEGDGGDLGEDNDEPLESDLDEEEDEDVETRDLVLCVYEKVTRVRNKWKCQLSNGIMRVSEKDYLFHKGSGDFEW